MPTHVRAFSNLHINIIFISFSLPRLFRLIGLPIHQNCFQREAVLRPENNQVIILDYFNSWSGCILKNSSNNEMITCIGSRHFHSRRERWWYVAVSHCGFEKVHFRFKCVCVSGNDNCWLRYGRNLIIFYQYYKYYYIWLAIYISFTKSH